MVEEIIEEIKKMNEEELRTLLEDCRHGCLDHSGRPCQQQCSGLDGECDALIHPADAEEWAHLARGRLERLDETGGASPA